MKRWRVAGPSVLVAVMAGCCADRDDVPRPVDLSGLEEIRIDYEYSGWSWAEERFSIVPGETPGTFLLRGRYQDAERKPVEVEVPVATGDVATLVQLVASPAWVRDTAVEALAQRADRRALRTIEPMSVSPPPPCSDAQLQRLANLHLRGRPLRMLVDDHYTGMWTDDYPSALVQVRWQGRPSVVMWSTSQKTLMLPLRMGVPSNTRDAAAENGPCHSAMRYGRCCPLAPMLTGASTNATRSSGSVIPPCTARSGSATCCGRGQMLLDIERSWARTRCSSGPSGR